MGKKMVSVPAHRRRAPRKKEQGHGKSLIEKTAEKDFERMSKMFKYRA